MRKLLGGFTAILGLFATTTSGWLLVRGPFFGGATVNSETMMAAIGAFLIGIVLFGWGSVRWSDIGARI